MTKIPAKMPSLVKKIFPNYVWDFFSERHLNGQKTLYLTFDDGPQPEISEFVLEELSKHKAKATFFCIGDNVKKHPDIFQKMVDGGHAIGNHTQNHLEGWKTTNEEYLANTLKAQQTIDSKTINGQSKTVKLFRPPYGRVKNSQAKQLIKLGYKIVMWDVVAKDWMVSISEELCLRNIMDYATNGSIIVMHDSIKASKNVKYVLPKILQHFTSKGFQFKAIDADSYRD